MEEKPDAARTSGQGTDFLLAGTASGDFHILYPDNDLDRATDERRMARGRGRHRREPSGAVALRRWHPAFADAFAEHVNG